jgi:hypothetical protein
MLGIIFLGVGLKETFTNIGGTLDFFSSAIENLTIIKDSLLFYYH